MPYTVNYALRKNVKQIVIDNNQCEALDVLDCNLNVSSTDMFFSLRFPSELNRIIDLLVYNPDFYPLSLSIHNRDLLLVYSYALTKE